MSVVSKPVRKPSAIRGSYHGFEFANGLKCVVVEDPGVEFGAVCMCVRTGMFHDPTEVSGMAHFCEHMLFNGSSDFPSEDEFTSYVEQHSGTYNAFTSSCCTTYYAKIPNEAFEGLLKRFLPFFVSPSMEEGCVSREVMAVHSEDMRNRSLDQWRGSEILRSVTHREHPFSRYGPGNKETLLGGAADGKTLSRLVRDFYQEHYYASVMSLAIYSPRRVSEVSALVFPYVEKIPTGPALPPVFSYLNLKERSLPGGAWINVLTSRSGQGIAMIFEIASPQSEWKKLAGSYISHILGHECDSSVFGILQQRGLATALVAGAESFDDDREKMKINIALTIEGMKSLGEVISMVFYGIGMSIQNGVNHDVYQSMKAESILQFESSVVHSLSDHCINLASGALMQDVEHCFPYHFPLEDDFIAILDYVRQMIPSRCSFVMSWGDLPVDESTHISESIQDIFSALPSFAQKKADKSARFSQARYSVTPVPEEWLTLWAKGLNGPYPSELQLPRPNRFIARDLTIYPPESNSPDIHKICTAHGVTYLRKDWGHHQTFMVSLECYLLSPVTYTSPQHRLYTRIMRQIIESQTREFRYDGQLASLENSVESKLLGMRLCILGPEEQIASFFISFLQSSLDKDLLSGSQELYDIHAVAEKQKLENEFCRAAYAIASDKMASCFASDQFTSEEILESAPMTSYEGYLTFLEEYFARGFLFECFAAGNIKSVDDLRFNIIDQIEVCLHNFQVPPLSSLPPTFDSCWLSRESVRHRPGAPNVITSVDMIYFNAFMEGNKNVSTLLAVDVGPTTPRNAVLTTCVSSLLSSSFFQALRTDETLGYVVFCRSFQRLQSIYLYFLVESSVESMDALYLISRIIAYLDAVEKSLDTICNAETVSSTLSSIAVTLKEPPTSVSRDTTGLRNSYVLPLGFASRHLQLEALQSLTAQDVKEFMQRTVLNGRDRRALVVAVDRWRSPSSERQPAEASPEWAKPGHHVVALPPYHKAHPETEVAAPSLNGLQLPRFDEESSPLVDFQVKKDIKEFRKGLPVLKYNTRFRDVGN